MQTLAKGKATPIHSHAHCEVRNMSRFALARLRTFTWQWMLIENVLILNEGVHTSVCMLP